MIHGFSLPDAHTDDDDDDDGLRGLKGNENQLEEFLVSQPSLKFFHLSLSFCESPEEKVDTPTGSPKGELLSFSLTSR